MVLGCLLATRAVAVEPALISVGDSWAFLVTTNEPSAEWKEPGLDDSGWRRGDSGFGPNNQNTLFLGLPRGLDPMFFRREFVVANPAEVAALVLRLDWQGGFVAYLNGHEISRQALGPPGSAVTFTNRADWRAAGFAENFPLTNGLPLLRSGTNVLAVRVHPPATAGADLVFVPELLANFHRGPYAQQRSPESLDILWRTPLTGPARVEFGPTPGLGQTVPAQATTAYVFAPLTGLVPGGRCHYRVVVDLPAGRVESPIYEFRLLPAEGPMTALLFGDSGNGARSQFAVAHQFHRLAGRADVFVHLGDIAYLAFHDGLTDPRCLSVYREEFRSLPSFMTWGNHDVVYGATPYRAAFRPPTNDTPAMDHLAERTGADFYYSFDAGDAHFAVLYLPHAGYYAFRTDRAQYRWLEQDLTASKKRWKFLCLHHPVNTSGAHRRDDLDLTGVMDRLEIQEVLLPLAERHGVRLIFSGHDHQYERFQPVGRVHTVVSGGGGYTLYDLLEMDPNSATFRARWHLSRLEIRDDTLRLAALGTDGKPIDVLEFRDTPADSGDADGDGLGDLAEALTNSDPHRPDTDGDGLSDGWEFLRGLDPAAASVAKSADGVVGPADPVRLAEVLAESIPRPRTELRIHPLPDGHIQLRWLASVGARVLVESAVTPDGEFLALPEASPARPVAEDRQALELSTPAAARYFRARLVAP